MSTMRRLGTTVLGPLSVAAFLLAACGGDDPGIEVSAEATGAGRPNRMDLSDVESACVATATEEAPGIAIIDRTLQDANASVELPDCIRHLEAGADVRLNNVQVSGGTINVHDRDTPISTNEISLQNVELDVVAILVELNDVDDRISSRATDIRASRGVSLRAWGSHKDSYEGGDIHLVSTSISASDADSVVHILASEYSGRVRLVGTTVDTPGALTVLAHECSSVLRGIRMDCSTSAMVDSLDQ